MRNIMAALLIALATVSMAGLALADGDCSSKTTQTTTVDAPKPATVASSK
jgi:hypothetical protein